MAICVSNVHEIIMKDSKKAIVDINKRAKQYSDENWLIMEPTTTEKSFKAGAEWYRDNVVNNCDTNKYVLYKDAEEILTKETD